MPLVCTSGQEKEIVSRDAQLGYVPHSRACCEEETESPFDASIVDELCVPADNSVAPGVRTKSIRISSEPRPYSMMRRLLNQPLVDMLSLDTCLPSVMDSYEPWGCACA